MQLEEIVWISYGFSAQFFSGREPHCRCVGETHSRCFSACSLKSLSSQIPRLRRTTHYMCDCSLAGTSQFTTLEVLEEDSSQTTPVDVWSSGATMIQVFIAHSPLVWLSASAPLVTQQKNRIEPLTT